VYESEYLFKSSKACWPIFEYPSSLLYNWKETVDRKKYNYIGIILGTYLAAPRHTSHGASGDSNKGNGVHSGGRGVI
jgi:hypothetical protein